MKIIRKATSTMVAIASLYTATAALAGPVTLGISAASITPGSGYGIDSGVNGENGGTLLDVRFSNVLFSSQSLSFAAIGDTRSFTLGTVNFAEPDTGSGANRGIRNQEQDGLGISVAFTFTDLLGTISNLTGTGIATLGPIADAAVDFTLAWDPLEVDFGAGGKFSISLNSLSFSNIGTQTETATVTLLAVGSPPPQVREPSSSAPSGSQAVPEPGSLALVGIAFAGACVARRRRFTPAAALR